MKNNLSEKESENLIYSIDEENLKCADCNSPNPTFISVNNGITICSNCVEFHKKLGNSISFIRKIDDKLDSYILNFFTLGSNSKFHNMIENLKINNELPIYIKYKTYGVDYYRRLLKAKVLGQKLINKDFNDPNKIKENIENNYPEFKNYKIKDEDFNYIYQNKNNNKTFFDKIKFFNKKDNKNNKEKNKKGDSNIDFNTKQDIKKEEINMIGKNKPSTSRIIKGVNYIGEHVKGAYQDLKNKIIKNKNDKNYVEIDINNENKNNNNNNNNNHNNNNNNNNIDNIKGEMINNPLNMIIDTKNNNNNKEKENEYENIIVDTNHNLLIDEKHNKIK